MKSFQITAILMSTVCSGCFQSRERVLLESLEGSWSGSLSCAEEGGASNGLAVLNLAIVDQSVQGDILFEGSIPSEFSATANLELWVEDESIDGKWSDCEISYAGEEYISCHFWHEEQSNGFVLKPNIWSISDDGATLSIKEAYNVESEAQTCHGEMSKESTF